MIIAYMKIVNNKNLDRLGELAVQNEMKIIQVKVRQLVSLEPG
jgi:hypothetical protein